MAEKSNPTQSQRRSTPHTVDDDDILEVVGLQGVATALQVQQWYGAKKDRGIRNRMTKMCRRNNPLLISRNMPL
ncbi:MAG TPA: hypothetical protein PKH92_13530, partial [Anaerolineaceae bacterium]|nr:hypothetical protein [Anaerolineaceae bacterium]